ncbi:MarR family winged helix-turn-helix transcriptional regulator [Bailinhaonella thermotolerans]|uniref:MarR family transcriptional regulator n=1 Tax=Bailinhaonella thermotolerans TaxID=1070861 RepID=A0A3A4A6U7_9ACTN|nr:MarR family transcriptional regulator [Bailinhaonella thermotolerans]RJL22747.1 MarR family transcriptional regulator [Bailinhaonella thermotolerans]
MQDENRIAAQIDAALFRLRRMWAKPTRARAGDAQRPVHLSHITVTYAVRALAETSPEEITVGAVAERLDVDPSTASRLVHEAIAAGFVEREPSRVDARRVRLVETELGAKVIERLVKLRREHLQRLMADWDEGERAEFARLFARFADASAKNPPDYTKIGKVVDEVTREHRAAEGRAAEERAGEDRAGEGTA